jgi:hypothetical protein
VFDSPDKRNHIRQPLNLKVRFITQADMELCGRLLDVSEGGLRMETKANAAIGDEVIAYPEGLGRLTGKVIRKNEKELAVEFDLSMSQREHLAKRIASALSGVPYLRLLDNRLHNRIEMNLQSVAQEVDSGESFDCEITNFSTSGAAIRSIRKPKIGVLVQIGTMRGRVCRLLSEGFAIEFEQLKTT